MIPQIIKKIVIGSQNIIFFNIYLVTNRYKACITVISESFDFYWI